MPWADLARCSAQNCKKWTDQCEDCSLKKKKGHCYSRAFFLKRKTRRLKIRPFIIENFVLRISGNASYLSSLVQSTGGRCTNCCGLVPPVLLLLKIFFLMLLALGAALFMLTLILNSDAVVTDQGKLIFE